MFDSLPLMPQLHHFDLCTTFDKREDLLTVSTERVGTGWEHEAGQEMKASILALNEKTDAFDIQGEWVVKATHGSYTLTRADTFEGYHYRQVSGYDVWLGELKKMEDENCYEAMLVLERDAAHKNTTVANQDQESGYLTFRYVPDKDELESRFVLEGKMDERIMTARRKKEKKVYKYGKHQDVTFTTAASIASHQGQLGWNRTGAPTSSHGSQDSQQQKVKEVFSMLNGTRAVVRYIRFPIDKKFRSVEFLAPLARSFISVCPRAPFLLLAALYTKDRMMVCIVCAVPLFPSMMSEFNSSIAFMHVGGIA